MRFLALIISFFLFEKLALVAPQPPAALSSALIKFAKNEGASPIKHFRYVLTDLNADNILDAVVLLGDSYWCGSGGCTMLVFKGQGRQLRFVSSTSLTDEPIIQTRVRQNGWSSLIVYSPRRGKVILNFNGKQYPENPSTLGLASDRELSQARILIK